MSKSIQDNLDHPDVAAPKPRGMTGLAAALLLFALLAGGQGCASLSNPVAQGIPVRRVPPELLGESKEGLQRLPLTLLRQPPPPAYKLAAGDVLGVWIEGVLGEKGKPPPVIERKEQISSPSSGITTRETTAIGYPIPIREDGTLTLPLVPRIKVAGLTLEQAEEEIRKAYTQAKQILAPGRQSVIVMLYRPRQYHVLVIRQDGAALGQQAPTVGGGATGTRSVGFGLSLGGGARGARQGTGHSLDLPAYENDVLNALARTGGLPGTDAADAIIIERGSFQGEQGRQNLVDSLLACPGSDPLSLAPGTQRIRIPLRYRPGQTLPVRPEDVILQTGDIVLIESREAETFYAAGLLAPGEYPLPRDTDLDIVEAILRIGGPIFFGGFQTVNIAGNLILPGLSLPRPTLVSIVRPTPCGKQVVIKVDLERALREPRERILIQPKDLILLQETPQEALGRYLYEVLNFPFSYRLGNGPRIFGSIGYNAGYTGVAPVYP
ncbi:MAG: polysaccharide biosynthesis/export family protein [Gemmataceae bacterium]